MSTNEFTAQSFGAIRDLIKAMRFFQNEAVVCEDITFTQFTVLDFVRSGAPLPIGSLNDLLGVEKSTTTRLVAPLLKKGLLSKRKSNVDARISELALTAEGQRVYDSVWACYCGCADQLLSAVPEAQRGHLLQTMQLLSRSMECCCGPAASQNDGKTSCCA